MQLEQAEGRALRLRETCEVAAWESYIWEVATWKKKPWKVKNPLGK